MLAVHFGAGNIGRGFIGQLLHEAGYEICFVDVNENLVDALNRRREYQIRYASEEEETFHIKGVKAVNGREEDKAAEWVSRADLVTTAVGPDLLERIAPVIANGISKRARHQPLNIIACENRINASSILKQWVEKELVNAGRERTLVTVGFPNTAVDRIVPVRIHEDPLTVTVEPFCEWVVNRKEVVGEFPPVKGITYVDDLMPYIERKLFTVNTGHAVLAYLGYQAGVETVDQAARHKKTADATRQALLETGALLVEKYAFSQDVHDDYIDKILSRFANPYLFDGVRRVGRSPIRKLSIGDRLVNPAMQCCERNIAPNYLSLGIAAALCFDDPADPEAIELQAEIQRQGPLKAFSRFTSIPADHKMTELVMEHVRTMKDWKTVR